VEERKAQFRRSTGGPSGHHVGPSTPRDKRKRDSFMGFMKINPQARGYTRGYTTC